jgi:hypothetical protein
MIGFDIVLCGLGRLEVIPRADGLHLMVSETTTPNSEIRLRIPLTELLRYAKLVKLAADCPPGWDDLASTAETIR